MFARTDLCAFIGSASLLDEKILERFASVCAIYIEPIAFECIPEMPCHISELRSCFLPELERSRIVRSKIRVNRD